MQYYSVNLNNTEKINLTDGFITFGFGLTNNNKTPEYDIYDLFDINVEFTSNYLAQKRYQIDYHQCEKKDFHNLSIINESIYKNLKCIKRNNTPEGFFTSPKFSFYTISVESKYKDDEEHNKLINKLVGTTNKIIVFVFGVNQ